jgi:hypothetical protein
LKKLHFLAYLASALGLVIVFAAPQSLAPPAPPAYDNYDVGITLKRLFKSQSPSEYGNIMWISNVRDLGLSNGVRKCSAELTLNRSWSRSANVYAVYTVVLEAGSSNRFRVALTRMDDL